MGKTLPANAGSTGSTLVLADPTSVEQLSPRSTPAAARPFLQQNDCEPELSLQLIKSDSMQRLGYMG